MRPLWPFFIFEEMLAKSQQLRQIIAPAVEVLGYEFVGCEMHSQPGRTVLRVFIDGPNGISVDDCAKASRQISASLDVEDPIRGRYNLEVSSPGLERPLYTAQHYRRFVGHPVRVRLRVPRDGQRQYRGLIEQVEGELITVNVDKVQWMFNLDEIEKANLIADFEVSIWLKRKK